MKINEIAESSSEDRFKKYIRPVVKTTPKIEKTTNPSGRTTDHIEWKVTTPTGEIHRYKSKKQAQEHFDSFGQQGVAEYGPAATAALQQGQHPIQVAAADRKDQENTLNINRSAMKAQQDVANGLDPTQTAAGNGVAEAAAPVTHRIGLTVTDPNHPMISKRGETYQKSVRVTGPDREAAINQAIAHHRRKGYKVHDHHYLGTVDQGVAEGSLNELSSDLLKRSAQVATDKRNQAMDPELHNALGGGYMNPLATHYDNVSQKMDNRAAQVRKKETIQKIASKIASPAVMRKMGMSDMEEGVAEGENWSKHNNPRAGGMSKKSVSSYRRSHPGSKIQTAVTTKPSKLKKGSKSAKRRASFCARMRGMKKHRTGAKTANDPNSNINKSLRRWHCESIEELHELVMLAEQFIRNKKNEL